VNKDVCENIAVCVHWEIYRRCVLTKASPWPIQAAAAADDDGDDDSCVCVRASAA